MLNTNTHTYPFLADGGEMGQLTREHNWSATPLGTPDQWPLSLKTTLGILLHSAFPMFLFWGNDLLCFYNDAYRPSLGDAGKHPALGKPARTVWPEIWDFIGPLIDQVRATGEAVWFEDQLLPIHRNGQLEDVYWTFSYSPAYDDAGQIGGVFVTCSETTKQVLAFGQLQSSEKRFQNLIREAPVAMALFRGPQFVIELANEQVLAFWGRQREQVINKPLFEALPEAKGQGFEQLLTGVYTSGERFVANELPVTLKRNGRLEQTFINFVYEPYREADGTISGITVVCIEITEQVLARQKIEESEARYRSLIEEAPVATALYVGSDLVIDVANEAVIRFYGKDASMVGKPMRNVVSDSATDRAAVQLLEQVFATGEPFQATDAPADLTIDGVPGTYYFDFSLKPLRNAAGEVYAILQTAVDVTQQVLARQQVQEAEETLRGAIEVADIGTWYMDFTTSQITYSDRLRQMLELSNSHSHLDAVYNPVHEPDRARIRESIRRASNPASDGITDDEYTVVTQRTGRHRLVRAQAKLYFDASGQPYKMVGTMRDITEQREMQLALEQLVQQRTEELSAANAELSESNNLLLRSNENLQKFAYVASHDLQEPLRKIQSFGDLLKTQYADTLGDGVDLLVRMQSAASRMSVLIRDLLNFSRISTQRETNAPVPLNEVVSNVLLDMELAIADASAVVNVANLPTVQGDAMQLGQLFQNLIGNSLKFRHANVPPRIIISSRLVAAADLPPDVKPSRPAAAYHCIDVQDNGIGFDPRYVDRIFQVFQRLHNRSNFTGTGIGLAICEKVATNHGGAITAHSQPDGGATFSVYLLQ